MAETAHSINHNNIFLVSRNTPVALVVGAGGFLGSHLVEGLLKKGIQVIGVDDFSTGSRKNLDGASKDKNFHLIDQSISQKLTLNLPRLDYAYFSTGRSEGLHNFLELARKFEARVIFVSSILLYDSKIPTHLQTLKQAEIELAKFSKNNHLNARVIRLAALYGPRMHFLSHDPVTRLIQASLLNELQSEQTSLEFSSRSLYIDDAISLLIKAALHGGTAGRIYDGCLVEPIEVSEIKQVLLDPVWYESRGFKPTEIPPWPTPNLKKSQKELSWKPETSLIDGLKKTVSYFKDNNLSIPTLAVKELEREAHSWIREEPNVEEKLEKDVILGTSEARTPESKIKSDSGQGRKTKKWRIDPEVLRQKAPLYLCLLLIIYALVFPILSLGLGLISIRSDLRSSVDQVKLGNFSMAQSEVRQAHQTLSQLEDLVSFLSILKKINFFNNQLSKASELLQITDQGILGLDHTITGTKDLFEVVEVVTGEKVEDPAPLISDASTNLGVAQAQVNQVSAQLNNSSLTDGLPGVLQSRVGDYQEKLIFYASLVNKAQALSQILPELIALNAKKSYLVILTNNLNLRGSGGVISSYGLLNFERGKLKQLKVDSIDSLDAKLTETVAPPSDLTSDLKLTSYFLKDSNFEPDWPTAARQIEFFYSKEAGARVNGVIALDLNGVVKLLSVIGGLDLPNYNQHLDQTNLIQSVENHSQDPKYLVSLETELLNKIFFLPKQNWPGIITSLGEALDQKSLVLYLDDTSLFSSLQAENWAGVLPRPLPATDGQTNDFLGLIDSNVSQTGLDKKSIKLTTSFNGLQINQHLELNYDSSFKNRLRLYLPLGAKLTGASQNGVDILKSFSSFSDYGRVGYSGLIDLSQGQKLVLDYSLFDPLNFKEMGEGGMVNYRLNIFKQIGSGDDSFDWSLNYSPYKLISIGGSQATSGTGVVNLQSDLSQDRLFEVGLAK